MTACSYSACSGPMALHGRALIDLFGMASTITGTSRRDVPIGGYSARRRFPVFGGRACPEDCLAGARYAGVPWWKRSCHEEPARSQIELRLPTAICWWRT